IRGAVSGGADGPPLEAVVGRRLGKGGGGACREQREEHNGSQWTHHGVRLRRHARTPGSRGQHVVGFSSRYSGLPPGAPSPRPIPTEYRYLRLRPRTGRLPLGWPLVLLRLPIRVPEVRGLSSEVGWTQLGLGSGCFEGIETGNSPPTDRLIFHGHD